MLIFSFSNSRDLLLCFWQMLEAEDNESGLQLTNKRKEFTEVIIRRLSIY